MSSVASTKKRARMDDGEGSANGGAASKAKKARVSTRLPSWIREIVPARYHAYFNEIYGKTDRLMCELESRDDLSVTEQALLNDPNYILHPARRRPMDQMAVLTNATTHAGMLQVTRHKLTIDGLVSLEGTTLEKTARDLLSNGTKSNAKGAMVPGAQEMSFQELANHQMRELTMEEQLQASTILTRLTHGPYKVVWSSVYGMGKSGVKNVNLQYTVTLELPYDLDDSCYKTEDVEGPSRVKQSMPHLEQFAEASLAWMMEFWLSDVIHLAKIEGNFKSTFLRVSAGFSSSRFSLNEWKNNYNSAKTETDRLEQAPPVLEPPPIPTLKDTIRIYPSRPNMRKMSERERKLLTDKGEEVVLKTNVGITPEQYEELRRKLQTEQKVLNPFRFTNCNTGETLTNAHLSMMLDRTNQSIRRGTLVIAKGSPYIGSTTGGNPYIAVNYGINELSIFAVALRQARSNQALAGAPNPFEQLEELERSERLQGGGGSSNSMRMLTTTAEEEDDIAQAEADLLAYEQQQQQQQQKLTSGSGNGHSHANAGAGADDESSDDDDDDEVEEVAESPEKKKSKKKGALKRTISKATKGNTDDALDILGV